MKTLILFFALSFPVLADVPIASVSIGQDLTAIAVNEQTNKIYVANGFGYITVIDGDTFAKTNIPLDYSTRSIAVNPVTNKIYVTDYTGYYVTIIDGLTNSTERIWIGRGTDKIAVNSQTNKIYVTMEDSLPSAAVIDGSTKGLVYLNAGHQPTSLAINPLLNKIFVASGRSNNPVTVIDGQSNDPTTIYTQGVWFQNMVVSPSTNKAYLSDTGSGVIFIVDGNAKTSKMVITSTPSSAMAINTKTNKIYAVNSLNSSIWAIDGATEIFRFVATGVSPYSVAVDENTNRVYVGKCGTRCDPNAPSSQLVNVFDGATNAVIENILAGIGPSQVVVSPLRRRVYVMNQGDGTVTVIDSTNASISGRIYDASNQPLKNASVAITGPASFRRTAVTNSFGVYTFSDIITGASYTVSVTSKRYRFTSKAMAVNANLSGVDFSGVE